jgi:hypothetical protein
MTKKRWSDARRGVMNQRFRKPLDAGKSKEMDFPLQFAKVI